MIFVSGKHESNLCLLSWTTHIFDITGLFLYDIFYLSNSQVYQVQNIQLSVQ
jgi:hypothetical protein